MNKKALILLSVLLFAVLFSACVKTAGPGEVGIRVNLSGDNRGVEEIPIQTGRIWYFPFTQSVIIFPTYIQSETYKNVQFNSNRGEEISADVSIAYSIDPDKVPELYVRFRQPLNTITQTYLQREVRTAFANIASTMRIEDIYGDQREMLSQMVTERVQSSLEDWGFNIHRISIDGRLTLPDKVRIAIDEASEAEQKANRAENEIRLARAEAEKAIEAARGEAEAERQKAQGKADAILIVAEAEAEANKLLVESLNGPENYIQLETINRLNPNIQVILLPSDSMPLLGVENFLRR